MSQPVKLSDALVLEARLAGEAQERSIAGQIEFWAKLGRSIESLLNGKQVLALRRSQQSASLSDLVDVVETPKGREMFKKYLESEPYPHYEACPSRKGFLVRIEEDGTRTTGRFVNRDFVPEPSLPAARQDPSRARRRSAKGRSPHR